jgi:acyl dehydratase
MNYHSAGAAANTRSASTWPERIELDCGPLTAVDLALYAAASGDHNPLHLDETVAKAAGFDRPIVHGMLTMALCGRLLASRFGPGAVRALAVRFVGAAFRGDRVLLIGTLKGVDDAIATYDIVGRNDAGKDLVTGTARVGGWPRAAA